MVITLIFYTHYDSGLSKRKNGSMPIEPLKISGEAKLDSVDGIEVFISVFKHLDGWALPCEVRGGVRCQHLRRVLLSNMQSWVCVHFECCMSGFIVNSMY